MRKVQASYAFTYESKIMGCELRIDSTIEIIDDSIGFEQPEPFMNDMEIHEITGMIEDGIDWTILKDFAPLRKEIMAKIDDETIDYLGGEK